MGEEVSDEAFAEPEAEALAFEVSETDAGARLDAFLAARVEGVSRTALKRAIETATCSSAAAPRSPRTS